MTTCETGLDFVPEFDGVFAEFPAEADVMAAVAADEIDQAHLVILQIAADFTQFFDVILQMLDGEVDFGLDRRLVFVFGGFEIGLHIGDLLVGLDDVGDDPADEGQRAIGFGELESLGGPGRGNGFWGGETRTSHQKRPPFCRATEQTAEGCSRVAVIALVVRGILAKPSEASPRFEGDSLHRDYDRSPASVNLPKHRHFGMVGIS